MHTGSAADAVTLRTQRSPAVASIRELIGSGWTKDRIRNQVQADRWQRIGRAVVLHNGAPTPEELRRAALIVLGPRAVLTAFTALEEWGLKGWERDRIHVLVPRGARVARPSALALRVHYTDNWVPGEQHGARLLHRPAPAAVRAAGTFAQSRPACGILAAIVQQRLARPDDLLAAVENAPRTRHRAVLLGAARDIGQGAHALSEIDFARLCRSAHLPEPNRQAVRKDRFERRRYLDVEWVFPGGRRVVVEVDGALHLVPRPPGSEALVGRPAAAERARPARRPRTPVPERRRSMRARARGRPITPRLTRRLIFLRGARLGARDAGRSDEAVEV
jgi:hypothetical protein